MSKQNTKQTIPGEAAMTFEQAMNALARDERFKATVYAMNSLLQARGLYSREEFEAAFVQWAEKEAKRKSRQRPQSIQASASV
ncbi:MAG: hypothetical protein ACE5MH_07975 [Terriglobia bacterium]